LTIEEVKQRIQKIKDEAYDDEIAHGLEDSLYSDFIKEIARRDFIDQPEYTTFEEIANLILTTKEIKFHRYCC